MNSIPVTIIDDFLDNPYAVQKWALSLNYKPSPNVGWPGKRTPLISNLNNVFSRYIDEKILSLFYYPIPKKYDSVGNFQIKDNFKGQGWVHQDPSTITSILYLSESENNENTGTSFFKLKKERYSTIQTNEEVSLWRLRKKHYTENSLSNEELEEKTKYENQIFEKTLSIPSRFNRLICFDGACFHAGNGGSKIINNRLTLTNFFADIESPLHPPILRSKGILSN